MFVPDISVAPTSAMKKLGESQDLVCTATGDNSITITWSRTTDNEDLTNSASEGVYNSGTGTISSTLSVTTIELSHRDTYTCAIAFGDSESASAEATLNVIGMFYHEGTIHFDFTFQIFIWKINFAFPFLLTPPYFRYNGFS